jgi:hypothetical protein
VAARKQPAPPLNGPRILLREYLALCMECGALVGHDMTPEPGNYMTMILSANDRQIVQVMATRFCVRCDPRMVRGEHGKVIPLTREDQ